MPVLIRIVLHAECKSDLWTLAIEFALDSRPLIITYFWWLQTAHCRQQPKYSIIVCPFQAYLQMFSIFVEWRTVWSTITFMMQLTRLHSRHNWYLITKSLNQKKKTIVLRIVVFSTDGFCLPVEQWTQFSPSAQIMFYVAVAIVHSS